MTTEDILDRLFRGEELSVDEGLTLRLALHWSPAWPFLEVMADCLEFGLPDEELATWPPAWKFTYDKARAVLQPLYDQWRQIQ